MKFYKFIATGFGIGYSKFAPGTMGALLALMIWLAYSIPLGLEGTPSSGIGITHIITFILIIVFSILGTISAYKVESIWGKDPSKVVVDEMVGVWIPLLCASYNIWYSYVFAFLLFRFFDIYKPLGIRKAERLNGGVGVMMDDILAGIYSLIILIIISYFNPFDGWQL